MSAPLRPSADQEARCRQQIEAHLRAVGQTNVEKNAADLLEDAFSEKMAVFTPRLPSSAYRRALVSGCSVGTEMIVARAHGMREVCGVEVNPSLVQIARARFEGVAGYEALLYDGAHLPYPDATFSFIASNHVIEHTRSPFAYLKEHLRVLERGGFMFLEFPGRYHPIELHTGTPSAEKYPEPLRSAILRYRESRFSGNPPLLRQHYREVRTELKPVSVWQLRLWLALIHPAGAIVHSYEPAPGFTRVLLRK